MSNAYADGSLQIYGIKLESPDINLTIFPHFFHEDVIMLYSE